MKKNILLATTLLTAPFLMSENVWAQCVTTQSCTSLGYSATSNTGNCLKCPFGNYWACPETSSQEPEKATLGGCTGYAKNCTIGQILNSDGTCSNNKVSGKTPIGVVVYISGGCDKCGYAMTASAIATHITWSTESDSTDAFQSSSWSMAIKDFDVSGNMTKIIQSGNASTYPAAYAALNYAPSAAPTSKGKWMLPTAGILNSLYTNLNAINNAISKVGGTQLTGDNEHIWSSAKYNNSSVWVFCTDSNFGATQGGVRTLSEYGSYRDAVVRPVLAF